jgi:hypothetical protein
MFPVFCTIEKVLMVNKYICSTILQYRSRQFLQTRAASQDTLSPKRPLLLKIKQKQKHYLESFTQKSMGFEQLSSLVGKSIFVSYYELNQTDKRLNFSHNKNAGCVSKLS